METEKKYALLIDADNVSPKYMDLVLRETKTLGDVSIRRIYGGQRLENIHGKNVCWKIH